MSATSFGGRFRVVLALAVLSLAAAAGPASRASTTYIGSLDSDHLYLPFTGQAADKGLAYYDYTFSLSSRGPAYIHAYTLLGDAFFPEFSSIEMKLYSGTTATGTPIASTSNLFGYYPRLYENLDIATLEPGTYLLDVAAVSWYRGNQFAGTISSVPIPAAFALFGSALAGLGLVSRKRRRGSSDRAELKA